MTWTSRTFRKASVPCAIWSHERRARLCMKYQAPSGECHNIFTSSLFARLSASFRSETVRLWFLSAPAPATISLTDSSDPAHQLANNRCAFVWLGFISVESCPTTVGRVVSLRVVG